MKYIKCLILLLLVFIFLSFIITILSYFDLIEVKYIKTITFVLTFLIPSIYLGNKTKNKLCFESLKISLSYILLSLIITLILPNIDFSIKTIISYLVVIITSLIGIIIGNKYKKFILKI